MRLIDRLAKDQPVRTVLLYREVTGSCRSGPVGGRRQAVKKTAANDLLNDASRARTVCGAMSRPPALSSRFSSRMMSFGAEPGPRNEATDAPGAVKKRATRWPSAHIPQNRLDSPTRIGC